MIPYSRRKLSDLYTLSQSKLLENHTLHSGTYLDIAHIIAVPPPPPGWIASNGHLFFKAYQTFKYIDTELQYDLSLLRCSVSILFLPCPRQEAFGASWNDVWASTC